MLSVSGPANQPEESHDCRYGMPYDYPPTQTQTEGFSALPRGGYFLPLLADPMEPRVSITYGRMSVTGNGGLAAQQDDKFTSGIGVIGLDFGSFRVAGAHPCNGYQFNFFVASYSLFDWSSDSIDLLNTDFRVGFPFTMRRGPYSARLRFIHHSSHLGDEFIIKNPGVKRVNLSYEVLEAQGSIDMHPWRIYGGGGLLIRSKPDLEHLMLQVGTEFRGSDFELGLWKFSSRVRPVYGVDLQSFQARDWGVGGQLVGGMEFFSYQGLQRFRLLVNYMHGYTPYGQFFTQNKAQNIGVSFQFDI